MVAAMKTYLTPREAAAILGIDVERLRELVKRGDLAAVVLGPRTIRIHPDALRELERREGGDNADEGGATRLEDWEDDDGG